MNHSSSYERLVSGPRGTEVGTKYIYSNSGQQLLPTRRLGTACTWMWDLTRSPGCDRFAFSFLVRFAATAPAHTTEEPISFSFSRDFWKTHILNAHISYLFWQKPHRYRLVEWAKFLALDTRLLNDQAKPGSQGLWGNRLQKRSTESRTRYISLTL